jgi:hypothetical protein
MRVLMVPTVMNRTEGVYAGKNIATSAPQLKTKVITGWAYASHHDRVPVELSRYQTLNTAMTASICRYLKLPPSREPMSTSDSTAFLYLRIDGFMRNSETNQR